MSFDEGGLFLFLFFLATKCGSFVSTRWLQKL
jgi:hypothetical protein